jgi:oxygen-independent coproporphyrinogen-3 oxidase
MSGGIYLHIPFCKQACSYCDFHFSTRFEAYRTQLIETISAELSLRKDYLSGATIDSVYFGGGTPSLLTELEIKLLMEKIFSLYSLSEGGEITLEANPDDITAANLTHWKRAGINRLSIGLQSFKESDLRWMNRAHNADEALKCVALAQEYGFDSISVDLIYGLPDLSLDDWQKHLETVVAMGVQHVSAYCLTVEEKTVLHRLVKEQQITPANEDLQSDQFLLLTDTLTKAGFIHYEISNFGKPRYEAVHNSTYWKGIPYLGVGPSAHSFNGTSRRWNTANNSLYIKNFHTNTFFEEEQLSPKDRWNELILTGLRTSHGVNLNQLAAILPLSESFSRQVNTFVEQQWMLNNPTTISLTKEGRLKADYIAAELFV